MAKVSILGAGTWGVALSRTLCDNGHEVTIWSKIPAELRELSETRTKKNLPGFVLDASVVLTADAKVACMDQDVLVMAVASPYVRETARGIAGVVEKGQLIVNVAKGIEAASQKTMTQVIADEIPQAEVAVLSGPSHAEEVCVAMPTSCVIGAASEQTALFLQDVFMNKVFRVYISNDLLGIEVGASLKNIIALAAGVCDGMGYGDNAKAALMTRGLVEITRLGIAMGGKKETFYGLSGVGDLIVTCASTHSRNRMAGYYMGQGMTMQEAMDKVNMVVEGVHSTKAAKALGAKYHVSMPIVNQVYEVLFHDKNPQAAVEELMSRQGSTEDQTVIW